MPPTVDHRHLDQLDGIRRVIEAERRLAPMAMRALGTVDHRLARSDAAIDRLRSLTAKDTANRTNATMALAEVLHFANRREELEALVAAGGAWLDDPRAQIFTGHAERCMRLLGLEMAPGVLAPEQNARTVLTLSHEQVRNPINRRSIGRWRNYEWAFDGSWDTLSASHAARLSP